MWLSTIQIIFLVMLTLTACVPIVIRPGAGGPVRDWPATADCPVPDRTASDAPKLVALMNAERAKVGLQPLILSSAISGVSHAYACETSARQDIGHVGTDGSKVSERLRRGGITASIVSENNAAFYRTPYEAMEAWMASPQHRENILRRDARNVGIGQAGEGLWAVWIVNFTS